MEQDKFLRDILASGIEQPSANFTLKVMKKIEMQSYKREEKVGISSLMIWMSVFLPIFALLVSLEPVYKEISNLINAFGISGLVNKEMLILLSLLLFFFCIMDIFLKKHFMGNTQPSTAK